MFNVYSLSRVTSGCNICNNAIGTYKVSNESVSVIVCSEITGASHHWCGVVQVIITHPLERHTILI